MTPYQFFLKHAGFSYGPGETREQGRRRCAKELAEAEEKARSTGLKFEWLVDSLDSSEWSDEEPPYKQWMCICKDWFGVTRATLCCIDFGRDGTPWDDPYRRVVEAELARDALDNIIR